MGFGIISGLPFFPPLSGWKQNEGWSICVRPRGRLRGGLADGRDAPYVVTLGLPTDTARPFTETTSLAGTQLSVQVTFALGRGLRHECKASGHTLRVFLRNAMLLPGPGETEMALNTEKQLTVLPREPETVQLPQSIRTNLVGRKALESTSYSFLEGNHFCEFRHSLLRQKFSKSLLCVRYNKCFSVHCSI